jgi:hypothetical protein
MATRPTRSTSRRLTTRSGERPTTGRTPKAEVQRTGRTGSRGSSMAENIIERAGLQPKVAGQMTITGRKPPSSLIPPALIEIGPTKTKRGTGAPIPDHVHQPKRPKDEFIDEGRLPKRKR